MAQEKSGQHSHQLLCALYGLNKSFSKKIIVGLEYDSIIDSTYKPVVRILGSDFVGIAFSRDEWKEFKAIFKDIRSYFSGDAEDLMDHKFYGNGWNVKFIRSYHEKAIEIEEDRRPETSVLCKRYRHTLVFKKKTFDCLNEYVSKCVDNRLEYLSNIAYDVSSVTLELLEFIKHKYSSMHEAQVQTYTPKIIKFSIDSIDDNVLEFITNSAISRSKDLNNQSTICKSDVAHILYQLVSFHMYSILSVLNS